MQQIYSSHILRLAKSLFENIFAFQSEHMEQDIAILIADLSGYTALTEAHGPVSAADLIDKYVEIVDSSLVGGSRLHERVGDEVMIVSDSPDHLLSTAVMLLQNVSEEGNFLQIHGALHYGNILKRNNNFFGSAINLTSRITSLAEAGSFLCSEDFLNALADKSARSFRSKGKFNFKNISAEKEVFEIITDKPNKFHIDPVCRMLLKTEAALVAHPTEANMYFCSENCLNIYIERKTDTAAKPPDPA